jgi:SpoVK/Ycf46/Vps4 family AAA+-type ATPase
VGLAPAKALIRQLTAQRAVAKQREKRGMKAVAPSPHLVFTGNPGTGKTTVARLVGQLYKSLGLLSSGHVIEADRTTLVSGYLGQSALKTRDVCKRALNGVLFIDEAYGLAVSGRDYGTEVIETLLTFMEAHRGDFVVVVAGYPDKMDHFMKSNPGLASRFDITVDFPDYSNDELVQIFEDLAKDNQYTLTSGARLRLLDEVSSWTRGENFGNARDVRKLFNNVVGAQAMLLADRKRFPETELSKITEEAFPARKLVCVGGARVSRVSGYGYL